MNSSFKSIWKLWTRRAIVRSVDCAPTSSPNRSNSKSWWKNSTKSIPSALNRWCPSWQQSTRRTRFWTTPWDQLTISWKLSRSIICRVSFNKNFVCFFILFLKITNNIIETILFEVNLENGREVLEGYYLTRQIEKIEHLQSTIDCFIMFISLQYQYRNNHGI